LVPFHDTNFIIFVKYYELADFEHVILGLETIGNDVSAERNEFDAFELAANGPANIIDAEL